MNGTIRIAQSLRWALLIAGTLQIPGTMMAMYPLRLRPSLNLIEQQNLHSQLEILHVWCLSTDDNELLLFAAENRMWKAVRYFVEKGTSVNTKKDSCHTLLHLAAQRDEQGIVELLISKGAHVNAEDFSGRTPLHRAAVMGLENTVELLIKHKADVNAKSLIGWTPLHEAAREGHANTVRLLVSKGADLEAQNSAGTTPIDVAKTKEIKALIQGEINNRIINLILSLKDKGLRHDEIQTIVDETFPQEAERRAKKRRAEIEKN